MHVRFELEVIFQMSFQSCPQQPNNNCNLVRIILSRYPWCIRTLLDSIHVDVEYTSRINIFWFFPGVIYVKSKYSDQSPTNGLLHAGAGSATQNLLIEMLQLGEHFLVCNVIASFVNVPRRIQIL